MKSIQNLQFTLAIFLSFLFVESLIARSVDIKFQAVESKTSNILEVEVLVKNNDRSSLILAGQNIRVYYNSSAIRLNASNSASLLPTDRYSKIEFSHIAENMNADEVNQLAFDNNMGFVSFSINLEDLKNGGISMNNNNGWVAIARLQFTVKSQEAFQLVFGRDGKTDKYATAFVEMAEWVAPYKTEGLEVNEITDLDLTKPASDLTDEEISVTIGPNPSSDYIQIRLNERSSSDLYISVRDLNGRIAKTQLLPKGQNDAIVSLSELSAANYIVQLRNNSDSIQISERISVVR